ncbi:alpha/beta hydrolase [Comamonas endophytica]|uniref:Lysophospholipase n=1 Tax=Comamonas endophytica TaxID=2949090 RepID=A0ABY6GBF0_9BURK|nr:MULTISPECIES: alpha/beta fold hydrolase [unclassified Acidovorax]MCD2513614.1 alpha/beta hydrolase [Acidovorax sp. D4N7]UYG52378.1 lysophospholipase [Acidovorax sp. 5MLIR]
MRPVRLVLASLCCALLATSGCSLLDAKQREWIFQPTERTWHGADTSGMEDVWIDFTSRLSGEPVRLHALWMPSPDADAPVLLYLHGARWNVSGSSPRIRRMQSMGFSVLAIDYRGFGQSTAGLPSEKMAIEDARAGWDWLAQRYPQRDRYLFGHSLGGAIAIALASEVDDERGTLVEGTFTRMSDVLASMRWGWLPVGPLLTQTFDSQKRVARIGSPLLVVHGSGDRLIPPALGERLYAAAQGPKRWVLVEGGSHHNTNAVGLPQYRMALEELFDWPAAAASAR